MIKYLAAELPELACPELYEGSKCRPGTLWVCRECRLPGKSCLARSILMPIEWKRVHDYTDIIYEHDAGGEGIAKITINRPEKRNAFRPETILELLDAFGRV